jgi:hypothetical protein
MSEPPIVRPRHRVCFSRRHAAELIAARPDVSATGCVYVRLDGVEAVGTSFVRALLAAWPFARPVGANEDVMLSWAQNGEGPPDDGPSAGHGQDVAAS